MAVDNTWTFKIESKIYTILETRLRKALSSTYPDLLITQQQKLNDTPHFPTIYIQMLNSPEIGADLEGSTVNAMMVTFETHITVNKTQGLGGCRKVAGCVLDNFKKLRFNVASRGEITRETSDNYIIISRFRRVIGANEEIDF